MNFLKLNLQRNHGSRVGILTWNFHSLVFVRPLKEIVGKRK
jgi:hypothetical protein